MILKQMAERIGDTELLADLFDLLADKFPEMADENEPKEKRAKTAAEAGIMAADLLGSILCLYTAIAGIEAATALYNECGKRPLQMAADLVAHAGGIPVAH